MLDNRRTADRFSAGESAFSLFRTRPDRLQGPPSLSFSGYQEDLSRD